MGKKNKDQAVTAENEEAEAAVEPAGDEAGVAEVETGEPEAAEAAEAANEAVDYRAEAEKNRDLYLRALADLENYRKRALRDKEDAIRFANDNLLREMIPVIDNLERAVDHAIADGDQDGGLLQGVQMTLEQFRKVLESFGVKAVEAVGSPFDPNFHQAMGHVVAADHAPNTVVEQLQKGYTLNNRLLRPALVMVAKAPAQSAAADGNENDPGAESGSDEA